MRHMLALSLVFSLSACTGLSGIVRSAGPACAELVEVKIPGSSAIAALLCPVLASAFADVLAAEGWGGRERGRHGGPCEPVQVSTFDPEAPRAAYICAGRVGGVREVERLYLLAKSGGAK